MANIIVVSVPESVILNSATIPADWARCLTQNDYNDVRQAVIKGEGQGKQRALLCSCVVSLFLCYPCMVRSQVDSYINRQLFKVNQRRFGGRLIFYMQSGTGRVNMNFTQYVTYLEQLPAPQQNPVAMQQQQQQQFQQQQQYHHQPVFVADSVIPRAAPTFAEATVLNESEFYAETNSIQAAMASHSTILSVVLPPGHNCNTPLNVCDDIGRTILVRVPPNTRPGSILNILLPPGVKGGNPRPIGPIDPESIVPPTK